MEQSTPSQKPQKRSRWKARLTLALIFSPFLAVCLALIFITGVIFVSAAFSDTSIELNRGNLLHEWLLEKPLSEFPPGLIKGTHRYSWHGGEISPASNTLIITTPELDDRHLKWSSDWLLGQGFTITHQTSSDLDFADSTGRRARIHHTKDGDGGRIVIRVDCYPR